MAVIHLSATAGSDGILHLEVPVGTSGPYEVQIVASPKAEPPAKITTPEGRGWPPGFFEEFVGCIDDDTFVAPERRRSVPRESFD